MLSSDQFISILKEKKYDFEIHRHEALFKVEDSNKLISHSVKQSHLMSKT